MNFSNYFPLIGFVFLLLMITGKIVYLNKKGVAVLSKSGKKQKLTVFLYPVFVLLILFFVWEISNPVLQIKPFHFSLKFTGHLCHSKYTDLAGTILIFSSLILMLTTLLHFRKSLRFGLDENNTGELIRTGIFCASRNPFFLSVNLYFSGTAFIFPSPFFIGFAVLALVSIHFFILKEEKFMEKVYRDEYRNYVEKVRRYL